MGYSRSCLIVAFVAVTLAALTVGGIAPAVAQSEHIDALNRQVAELREAGKYAEALALQRNLAKKVEMEERAKVGRPAGKTAEALGALAWHALLARSYQEALASSHRATALAPGLLWLETNRVHALLLTGRRVEARKLYLAHKQKRAFSGSDQLWEDVVAGDFDTLRAAGIQHPEFAQILTALGAQRTELDQAIKAVRAEVEQFFTVGNYAQAGVAAERYVVLTRERFGEARSECPTSGPVRQI